MEGITSYAAAAALFARCKLTQDSKKRPHSPPPTVAAVVVALTPNVDDCSTPEQHQSHEKHTPSERLQRSRERNRVHARKTRQRKKEQMVTLQMRADELKQEQVRLKQSINEKNTASILVGLFATAGEKDVSSQPQQAGEDPRIESLLKRKAEEIPDASKITELPALILPGQHNSKKAKAIDTAVYVVHAAADNLSSSNHEEEDLPDDGIDYQLLGKDRAKCTPEELDKIRRERNRMHAKRTRDRKRLFMEEMSDMCKQLEDENTLLRRHLQILDGESPDSDPEPVSTSCESERPSTGTHVTADDNNNNGTDMMDQLKTLIEVAGKFESNKPNNNSMKGMISLSEVASSVATAVSASDSNNSSADASVSSREGPSAKRRKLGNATDTTTTVLSGIMGRVPHSITTSVATVEV